MIFPISLNLKKSEVCYHICVKDWTDRILKSQLLEPMQATLDECVNNAKQGSCIADFTLSQF